MANRYLELLLDVNPRALCALMAFCEIIDKRRFPSDPCDGFERLGDDQRHTVLCPLTAALCDSSSDALHPTLVKLRDQFSHRLPEAEVQANDLLDELIAKTTERKVVRVQLGLSGREVQSREQLARLLAELEERIGAQLDMGARVRLV